MKKNLAFSEKRMKPKNEINKTVPDQAISDFIFHAIQKRREKYITLNELLDEANKVFSSQLGPSTSWFIIKTKQELENQGMLKISFISNRRQIIQMRKTKFSAKEYLLFQ